MDYLRIYNQLIQKRIRNPIDSTICKCQSHHIKPRSCGGSDDAYNLINLTMREHYIAHLLLSKIQISYTNHNAQLKAIKIIVGFPNRFNSIKRKEWEFNYNKPLYKCLRHKELFPTPSSYIQFMRNSIFDESIE